MKELREILDAYAKLRERGERIALATIVKAHGSTYRRVGARLLMSAKGEMTGSISGGCLEGDVFIQAEKVLASGDPVLLSYDTTSDNDLIWGLGLGCSGVVHVLVESLETQPLYWNFLEQCVRKEKPGVLVTVFRTNPPGGQGRLPLGSRLMIHHDGSISGSELPKEIIDDARAALQSGRTITKEYAIAEVLLEVIQPPLPFYVFGAGHDAIPVVRIAKEIGWNVTVVDGRPAFATNKRFAQADRVILSPPEDVCHNVDINQRGAVIVMTHNYAHDRSLLKQIVQMPVRYLAVLGPKKRTESLVADLELPEDSIRHIYSPAGLDIGAESPEEIAVAIISEIQAVLSDRSGGFLRNRKGPIHDR